MAKDWSNMSEAQMMQYLEVRGGKSFFGGKQIIEFRFPTEWFKDGLMKRMKLTGVGIDGSEYDIEFTRVGG